MIEKEIKPKKPPSYFEKQKELIEKDYRGKSKDTQIELLKEELAHSRTRLRISLDYWGDTLNQWRFWMKVNLLQLILIFLIGIFWGVVLFT